MKTLITLLALSLTLTACGAKNSQSAVEDTWWKVTPVDIADPEQTNLSVPALNTQSVPVYQHVSVYYGLRVASLRTNEGAGWNLTGNLFSIFVNEEEGRVAIYRCATAYHTFLSRRADCEGYKSQGRIGYLNIRPDENAETPVLRCTRSGSYVIEATRAEDCTAMGFAVSEVIGYAP